MAGRFMRAQKKKQPPPPSDLGGTSDAGALPESGGIPHQMVTDPPSPEATADMAAGGLPVVRGNSSKQPMNALGHAKIRKVGQDLAAQGGASEIIPSTAERTQETAQDLSAAGAGPITGSDPGLESHAMGNLEGQPKTSDVKKLLAGLIKKNPNLRIPGQGAMSGRASESFNEFRMRALSSVRGLMQKLAANPTDKIVAPTSTQVIKVIKAWIAAGEPDDFQVSTDAMLKDEGGVPGQMERLFPDATGKWELTPFDPAKGQFGPGIYFIRHGDTDSTQAQGASEGQKARAQIVAHVRSGDYASAKRVAERASSKGHLSDDEIGSAIDEALPSGENAGQLPPHELLAAASAAGPNKRSELMGAVNQRFGDLTALDPGARNALKTHLGRLRA